MAKKKSKKEVDTHSYRGWLNSDSFMKRALSVMGYSMVGTLVVYFFIMIIVLFFVLLAIPFN